MLYRFYFFLSILLCNADSALVSDSKLIFEFRIALKYSNYIQMFEFIFEC